MQRDCILAEEFHKINLEFLKFCSKLKMPIKLFYRYAFNLLQYNNSTVYTNFQNYNIQYNYLELFLL